LKNKPGMTQCDECDAFPDKFNACDST